jgi:hypothetical protein
MIELDDERLAELEAMTKSELIELIKKLHNDNTTMRWALFVNPASVYRPFSQAKGGE